MTLGMTMSGPHALLLQARPQGGGELSAGTPRSEIWAAGGQMRGSGEALPCEGGALSVW